MDTRRVWTWRQLRHVQGEQNTFAMRVSDRRSGRERASSEEAADPREENLTRGAQWGLDTQDRGLPPTAAHSARAGHVALAQSQPGDRGNETCAGQACPATAGPPSGRARGELSPGAGSCARRGSVLAQRALSRMTEG